MYALLQTLSAAAHVPQINLRRPVKNAFGDTNSAVLLRKTVRDASMPARGTVSPRLVQSAADSAAAF